MRLWYAGRAVPWTALLACSALVVVLTGAMTLWEGTAAILLPMAVAATGAVAGFLFDDQAVAVTSVTPRGGRWGRTTRLALGLLPIGGWLLLVPLLPDSLTLDTGGWWLVGCAACLLASGVALVAARRQLPRPGGQVAAMLVLLVTVPLVVGPFLGWQPVYPVGDFPDWTLGLWAGVAVLGVALGAAALVPGRTMR